jgi:uncharacterized protein (DUF362 family)
MAKMGDKMKPKVALVKGGNRAENIDKSLRLLGDEINLKGKKNVLVKVNFSSRDNQLGATHVDAVRALLKFLKERYAGKITIAESTWGPTLPRYEQFGYAGLEKEFGVELIDLNKGRWELVEVYDAELHPMALHFSRYVIDSDYRIAIGPAKTHDFVGVTLSIKNLAMGGLRDAGGDKRKMHQGYPVLNLNIYLLAKAYPLQLSVIDGYIGMEGDGPVSGKAKEWGVAVSSCEPVAADSLAAQLMGFSLLDAGYLWYCRKKGLGVGEMDEMEIVGTNPIDCYRKFRPHSTFEAQKNWQDERINKILGI